MPLDIKEHLATFVDTFVKLDVPREDIALALYDAADMLTLDIRRIESISEGQNGKPDKTTSG